MNIKKLAFNIFWTVGLFVLGALMLHLHWNHWVPLWNYETSQTAAAIDLVWAYGGGALGIICMFYAVIKNLLVRAAVITWSKK